MNSSEGQILPVSTPGIGHTDTEDSITATTLSTRDSPLVPQEVDIEHMPVKNDPRAWSHFRKNLSLALIASASMIAGLAANIQNPAVEDMERELPATSSQFSLSISLFILIQGTVPLFWSAISEVKGRKIVYLFSLGLFTIGSIVVAISRSISLVIGFRSLQAAGSSAVIAIGAATLADIFDPAERGTKMGVYYIAPLLGPAIGPIFGGVLTTGLNWRAIFWFLTIVSDSSFASFVLFFNDTFRRERSLTYQNVLKERLQTKAVKTATSKQSVDDLEKHGTSGSKLACVVPLKEEVEATLPTVKLSLKDFNPFKPIGIILRRTNNLVILFASGLLFALGFLITYSTARTLSSHYGYNALKIGLVTLSYGSGCVAGSLLGGRWSDHKLACLKAANGGKSYPEMRLQSTTIGVLLLPPFVLSFGWVCARHVHISAICTMLFGCGFFSIWTYTSTLAYIVDANNGRSSTAVATNSAFRGLSAFVATEIAVPLQDGLGDGWMYTIWAGLMALSGLLIFLVSWKGGQWREAAEIREARQTQKFEVRNSHHLPSIPPGNEKTDLNDRQLKIFRPGITQYNNSTAQGSRTIAMTFYHKFC